MIPREKENELFHITLMGTFDVLDRLDDLFGQYSRLKADKDTQFNQEYCCQFILSKERCDKGLSFNLLLVLYQILLKLKPIQSLKLQLKTISITVSKVQD